MSFLIVMNNKVYINTLLKKKGTYSDYTGKRHGFEWKSDMTTRFVDTRHMGDGSIVAVGYIKNITNGAMYVGFMEHYSFSELIDLKMRKLTSRLKLAPAELCTVDKEGKVRHYKIEEDYIRIVNREGASDCFVCANDEDENFIIDVPNVTINETIAFLSRHDPESSCAVYDIATGTTEVKTMSKAQRNKHLKSFAMKVPNKVLEFVK